MNHQLAAAGVAEKFSGSVDPFCLRFGTRNCPGGARTGYLPATRWVWCNVSFVPRTHLYSVPERDLPVLYRSTIPGS